MSPRIPSHPVRRALNVALKVRAGLNPRGECVSEEIPVPIFWAALSVYEGMFSRFVPGRRVLDLGCGPGYGPAALADAGAEEVVGIDFDRRNLRYAERRYGRDRPSLSFAEADIEALSEDSRFEPDSFDVVTSSNAFEHLNDAEAALDGVRRLLAPDGVFLVAIPPITNEAQADFNESIRYHRSNLTTRRWREILGERFDLVQPWAHHSTVRFDFLDPRPAPPMREPFSFEPIDGDHRDYHSTTITAIFECR